MNERIQNLAKQSWHQDLLEQDPNWKPREPANSRFMEMMSGTFEKFACSIQQDCLQHLTNTGQDHAREILERYFCSR